MRGKRKPAAPPARVALLGLGLIGGSLGLALRRARPDSAIAGYDPAPGVAERARERGAITEAAANVAAALAGANLVIIAAPTLAARPLLAAIAADWPTLAPNATITDVCSVKQPLLEWARELLPDPTRFVGGHPMAGSERAGIDAAHPDLYQHARWVITAGDEVAPDAREQVLALAIAAGARPIAMDAASHDRAVAGASHLPIVAAATLTQTLATQPDWPAIAAIAATGYQDTTRIAAGDPLMGRDILLTNASNVAPFLRAYIATLQDIATAIETHDAATIEDILRKASEARRAWEIKRFG